MLTLRALHPSRLAMLAALAFVSVVSSSSQRRPRAIDVTNVARLFQSASGERTAVEFLQAIEQEGSSIWCWRDHSAGRSTRRVTPMPWGSRPSIAARTRSGARNASEIVMLTLRALHPRVWQWD